MSGINNLARATMGVAGAGSLVEAYGGYRSGMQTAGAIDASRPFDLINAANKAAGLKYAADTSLAGAQRDAQSAIIDKNLALSKSRAISAAGGGGASDTSVVNQEALIEQQGEFNKAVQLFGGLDEFNRFNTASQNALLEGANAYNAKGVQASRLRSATRAQAVGTLLGSGKTMFDIYGKARYPKWE
ncbi:MAG: hypothetical protein U1E25_01050 [Methylocystis sp.]